jgi:isopentenyl diphosphate isomerase/L-lactate dehydrogenase-like FMN-dependent dehydrogenase
MTTQADRIVNVADARRRARRILPAALFDYIDGGSDDEHTMARNERAFRDLMIRPTMGRAVTAPTLTTSVLGHPIALPVLLAPCGMIQLVHPDGAVGVARAAANAGTIAVLSKIALCPPAEVAAHVSSPRWYQINAAGGPEAVRRLVATAADAGFQGLVVTLDGPPPGHHERDLRHGVVPPARFTPALMSRLIAQTLRRPHWATTMALAACRQAATIRAASEVLASGSLQTSARFSWRDVEWLRQQWTGLLLVKGVLTGPDAATARDCGADAVIVSNHGGRALDGVPATLDVLTEVVAAAGSSTEVLLDGGVRRAGDVVKALCLGARAVLIGRPFVYGLAACGQPGVERILEVFRAELVRTLTLMGCPTLADLGPHWLQPARPAVERLLV